MLEFLYCAPNFSVAAHPPCRPVSSPFAPPSSPTRTKSERKKWRNRKRKKKHARARRLVIFTVTNKRRRRKTDNQCKRFNYADKNSTPMSFCSERNYCLSLYRPQTNLSLFTPKRIVTVFLLFEARRPDVGTDEFFKLSLIYQL